MSTAPNVIDEVSSNRWSAIWLGCGIAIAVGAALRLAQYLSNQSHMMDESALLLNVLKYPTRILPFTRLDAVTMPVAAPPLFLLWLKAVMHFFGPAEWAVRLVPQLMGLAALPVMFFISRRILAPAAVLWAMWLMALSDIMIFESTMAKPYSGDMLIGLLIFGIALVWRREDHPALRLARASLLTSAAVWWSYASAFVFAALVLAMSPAIVRSWRGWMKIFLAILPAIISFAAVYWLSIRAQHNPAFLERPEHASNLGDWHRPAAMIPWAIRMNLDMFRGFFLPKGMILIAPALLGAWVLWRQIPRDIWWAMILLPIVSILAAIARAYPTGGTRLTMYLAPFLIMFVAAGCEWVVQWISRSGFVSVPLCRACLFLLLLAPQWGSAAYRLAVPRNRGNTRAALEYVRSHRTRNEPVYVYGYNDSIDVQLYWPNADAGVHLFTDTGDKPNGAGFWVLKSYYENVSWVAMIDFQQGDAQPDPAKSFHTHGGDAVFFHRQIPLASAAQ